MKWLYECYSSSTNIFGTVKIGMFCFLRNDEVSYIIMSLVLQFTIQFTAQKTSFVCLYELGLEIQPQKYNALADMLG